MCEFRRFQHNTNTNTLCHEVLCLLMTSTNNESYLLPMTPTHEVHFPTTHAPQASMAASVYLRKCKGAGRTPPPGAPMAQCVWTLGGVFITLLILSALSRWMVEVTEGEYFVLLGSFGGERQA